MIGTTLHHPKIQVCTGKMEEVLKNFVASLGTPLEDGQYNLPGYPDIDFYIRHIEVDV